MNAPEGEYDRTGGTRNLRSAEAFAFEKPRFISSFPPARRDAPPRGEKRRARCVARRRRLARAGSSPSFHDNRQPRASVDVCRECETSAARGRAEDGANGDRDGGAG